MPAYLVNLDPDKADYGNNQDHSAFTDVHCAFLSIQVRIMQRKAAASSGLGLFMGLAVDNGDYVVTVGRMGDCINVQVFQQFTDG
jgi:hypothetical protein